MQPYWVVLRKAASPRTIGVLRQEKDFVVLENNYHNGTISIAAAADHSNL